MQHTFFVHFFAVVLHDYNFQERLSYTFYGGNVRQNSTFSCSLFFHRRSFSPCIGGRLHFSFCYHKTRVAMRLPVEITSSCICVAIPDD